MRARLPLIAARAAPGFLAALLCCGALAATAPAFDPKKVVFLNDTADHKYDRALEDSLPYLFALLGVRRISYI